LVILSQAPLATADRALHVSLSCSTRLVVRRDSPSHRHVCCMYLPRCYPEGPTLARRISSSNARVLRCQQVCPSFPPPSDPSSESMSGWIESLNHGNGRGCQTKKYNARSIAALSLPQEIMLQHSQETPPGKASKCFVKELDDLGPATRRRFALSDVWH
jgi:hypothetical protein